MSTIKISFFLMLIMSLFSCQDSKAKDEQKMHEISKLLVNAINQQDVEREFSELTEKGWDKKDMIQGLIHIIDEDTTFCSLDYSVLADTRISSVPCVQVQIGVAAIFILEQLRTTKQFSTIDFRIHELPLSELRHRSTHELHQQKLKYSKLFKNFN